MVERPRVNVAAHLVLLYSFGVMPVAFLKYLQKSDVVMNPIWSEMSPTDILALHSSALALWMVYFSTHFDALLPVTVEMMLERYFLEMHNLFA